MKPRSYHSTSLKDQHATRRTAGNIRPVIKVIHNVPRGYPHWVEIFHRNTSPKGVTP
jgi:hypothetical protein